MSLYIDNLTRYWTPRVGVEAARSYAHAQRFELYCYAITPVFVLTYGIGHAAGSQIVEVASYGWVVVFLIVFVGRLVEMHRYRVAASGRLGIRISWRASEAVPKRKQRYEAWCEGKGLKPYAAEDNNTDTRQ